MSLFGEILLSNRSQELIAEYLSLCQPHATPLALFHSSVDYTQLIAWLHNEMAKPAYATARSKKEKETEFVLASLRAELLHDLLISMGGELPDEDVEENTSRTARIKFVLLALAGTLLAGCEGFDSIATMLGVLSFPSMAILITGLAFSILSIVAFYGFDLMQISRNLGVTLNDAPKLLDVYLLQMKEIKSIRKKINRYNFAELSVEELNELKSMVTMLEKRFQALAEASSQFDNALHSPEIGIIKVIASSTAGFLFFGSGFCAGQSVATFAASLIIPAGVPIFWPVILFSIIVGVAAFSIYWHIERAAFKNLASGWFGLDKEKIEQLCDKEHLNREEQRLEHLKEQIISVSQLANRMRQLENKLELIAGKENEHPIPTPTPTSSAPAALRASNNIYSFLPKRKPSLALDTLDQEENLSMRCR